MFNILPSNTAYIIDHGNGARTHGPSRAPRPHGPVQAPAPTAPRPLTAPFVPDYGNTHGRARTRLVTHERRTLAAFLDGPTAGPKLTRAEKRTARSRARAARNRNLGGTR